MFSSVPTKNDILVPETLLKKRKSQEKARAERQAEIEKKKAVSITVARALPPSRGQHDAQHTIATRFADAVAKYHLSGLT